MTVDEALKVIKREQNREYYRKNRDRIRAQQRGYRPKDIERERARKRLNSRNYRARI